MGMRREDWNNLTVEEWNAISVAYYSEMERGDRDAWERMRTLACIAVQPYSKKKLTPRTLLPLPWDNEEKRKAAKLVSKEEDRQRLEEILERVGKS